MPFKIRDTKTGLFSTGGCSPGWSKHGKTWSTLGRVKCHLAQWRGYNRCWNRALGKSVQVPLPDTWEVVEFAEVEGLVRPAREVAS